MGNQLTPYYQDRAREYEDIYNKPERQPDIATLKRWLTKQVAGSRVLEVACGTGYWTGVAAPTAASIFATDINPGPLQIACAKQLGRHVEWQLADAYALTEAGGPFDIGMAHFWWSHVAIADQSRFLTHVVSRLAPEARLLMIDNQYVEGSSTPISRVDESGNSYQLRRLADGSSYEILKNFPSRDDIERALHPIARRIEVMELEYYWAVAVDLERASGAGLN